jgi:hypothetical protein
MKYVPQVNDYVIWKSHIKGWVYFKCEQYITIESRVNPKNPENYRASPIHANNRLLVLCYHDQWKELKYVKKRKSVHEE